MIVIKRVNRGIGPLKWSRDEWLSLLVEIHGRAFGFFLARVAQELVIIGGCKIVDRSALGIPKVLMGGLHIRLTLTLKLPFS